MFVGCSSSRGACSPGCYDTVVDIGKTDTNTAPVRSIFRLRHEIVWPPLLPWFIEERQRKMNEAASWSVEVLSSLQLQPRVNNAYVCTASQQLNLGRSVTADSFGDRWKGRRQCSSILRCRKK